MTQSYPVHISREIERRWASRSHMAKSRVARNDKRGKAVFGSSLSSVGKIIYPKERSMADLLFNSMYCLPHSQPPA